MCQERGVIRCHTCSVNAEPDRVVLEHTVSCVRSPLAQQSLSLATATQIWGRDSEQERIENEPDVTEHVCKQ